MTAAKGMLEAALWGYHILLCHCVHHTPPGYGGTKGGRRPRWRRARREQRLLGKLMHWFNVRLNM